MHDIRSILRVAARRLETGSFLACLHGALVVFGVLAVVLLAVERVGAAAFWPWPWLGPVLAAIMLLAAVHRWSRRRRSTLQVAVEVDSRLDLREKLSTALHVARRDDPFARAAVEDAVSTARDPRVRERVRRTFPVPAPPRWWLSPLVVLLIAAVCFVPPLDLLAEDPEIEPAVTESRQRSDEAIEAVVKQIEQNPELSAQMSEALGEIAREQADRDALESRDEIQRDAIKRLTDLNKRLDDILGGEKGRTAETIDRNLAKLDTPSEGPGKEFAEALARGDFEAAQESLQKLMEDAQKGNLDAAQQQQLAKQLQDLASQMQQLARQQGALQQALQQAGLNPQLAQNPQALQQAIQNAGNLNEQQKQQLQQMAAAQAAAQQAMQGMGQAMQQMGQAMQAGQMQQAMQAMQGRPGQQGLAQQLNQLEMMQQMLQQAQAAANACQGQNQGLGQGLGMQQAMQQWMQQQQGGAFGPRGQGAGGKAPMAPTPTGTKIVQSPSQRTSGDIIARQFVEGPLVRGESQAEFRKIASAVAEGIEEAQTDEQIPAKYRDAHLHYFGELEKRVEAVEPPAASPSDDDDETAPDDGRR